MAEDSRGTINLENRHTGERLSIRRVRRGDEEWFELSGSLPPHSEGPPMHVHFAEDEEGRVDSGVISFVVDGRLMTAGPGESLSIPRGVPHRWWNEGDDILNSMASLGPPWTWTGISRLFSRS